MMFFFLVALALALTLSEAATFPSMTTFSRRSNTEKSRSLAAVLPGDPIITGGLAMGAASAVSLYSKVILARFALSWFPQLVTQFPILQPVFTVTEPYLRVFRSVIPPIAGFDISALPAIFCLDILGQTATAVGAEFPAHLKKGGHRIQTKPVEAQTNIKNSRKSSHFSSSR